MYINNNYQDTSTMFGHGRLIEFTSEHLHHLFATINQTTPKPSVHVRDEVINYFLTDYRHAKQCYEIMTAAIESFDRVYKIRPKEDADIQFLQENLYAWEQKAPKLAGELFNINQKHVLKSRQPNGDLNRFIPACAGNSSHGVSAISIISVHPRVCGEQLIAQLFFLTSNGSSPRVRGTALLDPMQHGFKRFIPACAGNRMVRS